MPDLALAGDPTPRWIAIVAAGAVVLALVLAMARRMARSLDERGEKGEFNTEGGRHDWRARRRRR